MKRERQRFAAVPATWRREPLIKKLIANYFIQTRKVDGTGKVVSRGHWDEISDLLRTRAHVAICHDDLKSVSFALAELTSSATVDSQFCRREMTFSNGRRNSS